MFQLIILVQLKEGADPTPIMDYLKNELPTQVPTLRRSDVRRDLGLTAHLGHNASFSWIADFDDEEGWKVYRDSEAHDVWRDMMTPIADQYLAVQTVVNA